MCDGIHFSTVRVFITENTQYLNMCCDDGLVCAVTTSHVRASGVLVQVTVTRLETLDA
jgi:hypothetical protein